MKDKKLLIHFIGLFLFIMFYLNSCQQAAQEASDKALVEINAESLKTPYNPMIFGGFIEHFDDQIYGGIFEPGSPLSDKEGFRTDVIEALKELKLSVVRWPGGCFASGYHWKDGIGSERIPVPDPAWGVTDPNTFGTDEFIKWCRLVGCEPYICTNAGNGTPQEMKEWVEYCNALTGTYADMRKANGSPDPFNVRFWSVGNENWGSHEIGAKTPEEWGPLVKESAELMLQADSTIILAAAATTRRSWTLPLLETAGSLLDMVAIHQYWLGFWGENKFPEYKECIMYADGPEALLNDVINIISEAGYRDKIKIAFDEWNLRGWHHPGFPRKEPTDPEDVEAQELIQKRDSNNIPRQYTMADAIFSASFLNACLRHCNDVEMTNIAPIVNTRGPLYVYPEGMVKRTTFHTLSMYANLLQNNVGSLNVISDSLVYGEQSIAIVDAIATVDDAGENWSVVLINRHPDEKVACTVKFGEKLLDGKLDATILEGDSPEAYNSVENPERVKPYDLELSFKKGVVYLPPHSLTIVTIKES